MRKTKQCFKVLFCLPAYTYACNRNVLIQDHRPQAKLVALKKKKITKKSRPTHDPEREPSILPGAQAFLVLHPAITASFFTDSSPHNTDVNDLMGPP